MADESPANVHNNVNAEYLLKSPDSSDTLGKTGASSSSCESLSDVDLAKNNVEDGGTTTGAETSASDTNLKDFLTIPVEEQKVVVVVPPMKSKSKHVNEREPQYQPQSPANMPPTLQLAKDGDDDDFDESILSIDKLTWFGYTKRQWQTVVIFGVANIFATTVISLQAPFYPREAESKGATATEYGLVFGCFQLTMFIMSPIYGSMISCINPRLMFNVGVFITGTCAILFGFLDYVEDGNLFITLSFIARIVQACGDSAFVTASFTIIALEFPDSVATTFATLETCSGVGLIVGPTIGGALYEVGGFILPFFVMGILLFTTAIATYIFLPGLRHAPTKERLRDSAAPSGFQFLKLIRLPPVLLAALSIVVSSGSIGFLAATLEPHVRAEFQLSPLHTGLIFIIDGGMYALSAPLWGRLCDQCAHPKYITLIGCCLGSIAFLFIGPPPFMPFDSILWVTCIGLVIYGVGVGASLVSAFIQALGDALAHGFPDSVSTYGLVSGLWTSAFALGAFIGPSVGGVLLDNFGFRQSSVYVLGSQAVMAILVLIFIVVSSCCGNSAPSISLSEREPLLTTVESLGRREEGKSSSGKSRNNKSYSGDLYGSF